MGEADPITIPAIYLVHIASKACPPLTFFTNEHIKNINFSPQSIVMKQAQAWGLEDTLSEKVQMLDMQKMITLWGNNDLLSCLSPLCYIEASKNLLKALKLVCKPVDLLSNPSSTTMAIKFKEHYEFFQNLDDFKNLFTIWYPYELKSQRDILSGFKFVQEHAVMKVEVLLATHSASHSPPSKRTALESLMGTAKIPHQSFRSDATSSQSQSFQDSSPVCFLCRKGHY
jgi:hypothetical protein